jgi:hypothetical protein
MSNAVLNAIIATLIVMCVRFWIFKNVNCNKEKSLLCFF